MWDFARVLFGFWDLMIFGAALIGAHSLWQEWREHKRAQRLAGRVKSGKIVK